MTDSVSVTEMVKSLNILQFAYRKHQTNKFVRIMCLCLPGMTLQV